MSTTSRRSRCKSSPASSTDSSRSVRRTAGNPARRNSRPRACARRRTVLTGSISTCAPAICTARRSSTGRPRSTAPRSAAKPFRACASRPKRRATPAISRSSTEARGVQVESRGRLFASTPLRLELSAFEAKGAGQRITLAGPARFAFPSASVEIRGLALASGAGRLTVDGTAGAALDLTLSAKALPLALAKLASPDLALDGALDASARIGGAASGPTGDWRLELARLSAPQLRAAGLAGLGLRASGRLQGARTSLNAALSSAAGRNGPDRRLCAARPRRRPGPDHPGRARRGPRQCRARRRRTERRRTSDDRRPRAGIGAETATFRHS